ncbi:exodeoxyribonuclease VII large subunit [Campylobacter sputorum]|uniref:exodeoxyribonuclease VII large subunit n=1 Tax=Campylobacter sputorum TaxID=206 RepID=UPI000B7720FB|nr:exodeoxyribonuclease VII large subunit [Campylobacter sputorum]ASM37307.1 exodeoxyribonuclease VII, large subunit [Campylobacter sputorum bv. faecalis CCUG 20703]
MLSVSELNEQAKSLLETNFSSIEVEGEISRLTKHSSGHWYFTLKDEKASISATMFKFDNVKVKFTPVEGMKIVASGKITLFSPSGTYQINLKSMRPSGEGELELAFKQLKAKLEKEGLFDISHKKPLPKYPKKIAIITSKTSAALQDMLKIATNRWQLVKISVFDSLTQGENAPNELIKTLIKADNIGYDTLIIARGGGSREDLWCFNDEGLARCIYALKTPIISAIGHEIDFSISDFVSDHRSPTPSAAMMDLLPSIDEIMQLLDKKEDVLENLINYKLQNAISLLNLKKSLFLNSNLKQKLSIYNQNLEHIKFKLKNFINMNISNLLNKIENLQNIFKEKENFFAKTKNLVEIRKNGELMSLEELKKDDIITIYSQNFSKDAKIIN